MNTDYMKARGSWGGGRGGILYFCFVIYPYIWYWNKTLRNHVTARSASNITIVENYFYCILLYKELKHDLIWENVINHKTYRLLMTQTIYY